MIVENARALVLRVCQTNKQLLFIKSSFRLSAKMHSAHLKSIFLSSVSAVEPRTLIQNAVQVSCSHLLVNSHKYDLQKPCYIVGFGKAVLGMAVELEKILGSKLHSGIVAVPTGIYSCFSSKPEYLPACGSKIRFIEAARNNLPDEAALNAATQIKEFVGKLRKDDILLVLISGGGSALLPLPKHPIELSEKLRIIRELGNNGADILELNCVRKKLSQLKGGGLAEEAYPARVISLILSDVVGDPIDFIASGPTVVNNDPHDAGLKIMQKYSLYERLPDTAKGVLMERRAKSDPGAHSAGYEHVDNYIIGNNRIAAEAAKKRAEALGYQSVILSTTLNGEVGKISAIYAHLAREVASLITTPSSSRESFKNFLGTLQISDLNVGDLLGLNFDSMGICTNSSNSLNAGICVIGAGEPTVRVTGSGKGGRNQQLALNFSLDISKLSIKNADISFLSCGTDGIDGPTDAAGAIGGCNLVENAQKQEIDPVEFLTNNDSYSFFSKYESGANLVKIGHTGTNVMDLHVLIISARK